MSGSEQCGLDWTGLVTGGVSWFPLSLENRHRICSGRIPQMRVKLVSCDAEGEGEVRRRWWRAAADLSRTGWPIISHERLLHTTTVSVQLRS